MSELLPDEQKDMYFRALKALDKAGRTSEHHKVPTTKEESEIMRLANEEVGKSVHMSPRYREGQYELIFANPKSRTAYLYDHSDNTSSRVHVWEEPGVLLHQLLEEESIA